MAGTFFGLTVAQSGLMAQRVALDVIATNIAHANDPTYRRQRVVMTENIPLATATEVGSIGTLTIGTGVRTGDILRIRDELIENRLRLAAQSSAEYEYLSNALIQLEEMTAEPSDTGLLADLDQFWAAWQKVATSPESLPLRTSLLEQAETVCARIRYAYQQMLDAGEDLNLATRSRAERINLIAKQITDINSQIAISQAGGSVANSLLDRRDALVVELSRIVAITQHGEGAADFVLSIGGRTLIQGTVARSVVSEPDASGHEVVIWSDDGEALEIQGGELKAITDLNYNLIPGYIARLDSIAGSLATEVNALHRGGKTISGDDGGDFFLDGSTAGTIALDPAIVDHPELVAASSTGAIGNGEIALQIAGLQSAVLPSGLTLGEMYRSYVGDIGAASAAAQAQVQVHALSLRQFTAQQQSISGVSLDEEMTNMVKFQQAYNAAARVISVMDEMLGVLIERTGVVGRL